MGSKRWPPCVRSETNLFGYSNRKCFRPLPPDLLKKRKGNVRLTIAAGQTASTPSLLTTEGKRETHMEGGVGFAPGPAWQRRGNGR